MERKREDHMEIGMRTQTRKIRNLKIIEIVKIKGKMTPTLMEKTPEEVEGIEGLEEKSTITCYECGEGHKAYKYPERGERRRRRNEGKVRVANVNEDVESSQSEEARRGEVIVTRRELVNEDNAFDQRKNLFRTRCKC